MLASASRAALPCVRAAGHARFPGRSVVPLAFALATLLAQLLLPLAHLEERRQAAHEAGALLCAGDAAGRPHLHAGAPGERLPHDAHRCPICSAAAQARSALADAAPRTLPAAAPARLHPAIRAHRPPTAEAPRRSAVPRAPPVSLASA